MDCYYCIVSTTEDPIADLCVVDALDDEAALARGRKAAGAVVGWPSTRASGWSGGWNGAPRRGRCRWRREPAEGRIERH